MALIRKSKTTNGKFLTKGGEQGPGDEERVIEVPGKGKMTVTITQGDRDAVRRDSRYAQSFGNDAAAVYAAGARFMNIEGKDVLLMGKGFGDINFMASNNAHIGLVRAGGDNLREVMISPDLKSFYSADIASGQLVKGRDVLVGRIATTSLTGSEARAKKAESTGVFETGGAKGKTTIIKGEPGRTYTPGRIPIGNK